MKEKIKKTITTSTIIFSLLAMFSLSSCNENNTTTTTSIENSKSISISENKTTTEETEFVFSIVETTTTTVATIKPIEEILSEKNINITLQTDYETPEHNPMIKSVYNLYTLEQIYQLVPFFAENYPLYEDGSLSDSFIRGIITRYEISLQTTTQEKLEPIVYLDILYSIKSTYFPNKEFKTNSNTKEEVLYILQNY